MTKFFAHFFENCAVWAPEAQTEDVRLKTGRRETRDWRRETMALESANRPVADKKMTGTNGQFRSQNSELRA